MISIFLTIAICAVSLLLVYDYFTGKRRSRQFKSKIEALETDLKQARELELDLKSEIASKEEQLHQAFEDPVTGMLGWQVFNDRLQHSINHAARHQLSLAVLVVDLDDFSIINDAFGVETGNIILREIGQRINACLRQVDSACRLTKDSFAVLLGQVSKPESAVMVAQRILQSISSPIAVKNHQLHLTSCIGLSLYPDDSADAPTLLRNADHALRSAKEKGKQTYQYYQETMQSRSQRELLLCTGLTNESLFKELIIQYQPIIDTHDKSIMCMDAVCGWNHPELGFITASELHYYAVRQRKINIISEWLFKHACEKFMHWQSLGFKPATLGIPLSIKQLENSNFVYRLSLVMQEMGFNPENLLLEITDNGALSSFDILEKSFNMLKYLNVKVGISDFGFGALTLRYLKKLSINYIRLDPVLIDDVATNERERTLVKSVIQFAQANSIQMIACGIETEDQVKILSEMGCTLMQGKLLGGLLSGDEVGRQMVDAAR